jgi:hypothetical protein
MSASSAAGRPGGPTAGSGRPAGRMTEPGILRPTLSFNNFDYQRHVADHRLADFVENFWTVTWDLRGRPAFTAEILPYPAVNLSVTNTEADVSGVVRTRYNRHLVGRGYVVGARFRPGCFRPFISSSVTQLTETHRPIAEILGRDTAALQQAVAATSDVSERVQLLTDFLLTGMPDPDPGPVRSPSSSPR